MMVEGKITTFTRLHSMVHHVVLGAHRPPRQHLAGLLRDDDIITSISRRMMDERKSAHSSKLFIKYLESGRVYEQVVDGDDRHRR